jgi:hypothetical protein
MDLSDPNINEYLYDAIEKLDPIQREIVLSELAGISYLDGSMTRKHWRYHRQKAFEIIKQHLGDK